MEAECLVMYSDQGVQQVCKFFLKVTCQRDERSMLGYMHVQLTMIFRAPSHTEERDREKEKEPRCLHVPSEIHATLCHFLIPTIRRASHTLATLSFLYRRILHTSATLLLLLLATRSRYRSQRSQRKQSRNWKQSHYRIQPRDLTQLRSWTESPASEHSKQPAQGNSTHPVSLPERIQDARVFQDTHRQGTSLLLSYLLLSSPLFLLLFLMFFMFLCFCGTR